MSLFLKCILFKNDIKNEENTLLGYFQFFSEKVSPYTVGLELIL